MERIASCCNDVDLTHFCGLFSEQHCSVFFLLLQEIKRNRARVESRREDRKVERGVERGVEDKEKKDEESNVGVVECL